MDNYTLSEVCYKNGFAAGQSAPIYIAADPMNLVNSASHSLEAMKNEILILDKAYGWLITIYEIIPDCWRNYNIVAEFEWNYDKNKYVERVIS